MKCILKKYFDSRTKKRNICILNIIILNTKCLNTIMHKHNTYIKNASQVLLNIFCLRKLFKTKFVYVDFFCIPQYDMMIREIFFPAQSYTEM